TQCQGAIRAIEEGVHFLVDDVRRFAYASMEELSVLEHRQANFAIAGALQDGAQMGFHLLPFFGFPRQNIFGAARRLNVLPGATAAAAAAASAAAFGLLFHFDIFDVHWGSHGKNYDSSSRPALGCPLLPIGLL